MEKKAKIPLVKNKKIGYSAEMEDYNIERPTTNTCFATKREFQPGETYYAVVVANGKNLVRRDYSQEAWQAHPVENPVAVWRCTVAKKSEPVKSWRSINEVLLSLFDKLYQQTTEPDKLYILALLLVRRHLMRLEESTPEMRAEHVLELYSPQRDQTYTLTEAAPSAERQEEIQRELAFLLRGNNPEDYVPSPLEKNAEITEETHLQLWNPDDIELPEVPSMEFPEEWKEKK